MSEKKPKLVKKADVIASVVEFNLWLLQLRR